MLSRRGKPVSGVSAMKAARAAAGRKEDEETRDDW